MIDFNDIPRTGAILLEFVRAGVIELVKFPVRFWKSIPPEIRIGIGVLIMVIVLFWFIKTVKNKDEIYKRQT